MSKQQIKREDGLLVLAPVLVEIIRNGKIISSEICTNLMPEQGRNYALDVAFRNQTPATNLYMGIFEANYTPTDSVTAATIAAAATESTAYTESTRQLVTYSAASSSVVNNSASPCVFTMNSTKTIYGMFISSDSAKGGTAGVLLSVLRFSSSKSVVSTDVIQITHTATLTSV